MRIRSTLVVVGLFAVGLGCGSSSTQTGPTGTGGGGGGAGKVATGGATGSGGAAGMAATGGSSGAAGKAATGGSSGVAGMVATGGSGGAAGMAATGGATGSGGTAGMAATGGSNGAGTGGSATGGAGGGTGTSACVLPNCLKNFNTNCIGSGTCTTQTNPDTNSFNTCYPNGITQISVHDINTDDTTLTVKKAGATCFSTAYNGNDVYTGLGVITVKNASGATVASVQLDESGTFYKATCTGSAQVALDPSCTDAWPISGLMGSSCTEGVCTP